MHALELRDELLFKLTPSEWWTWCYLVKLAHEQLSTHVVLPRPGEDGRAEKVFSRKHLKRTLKALKAKRHLTNIIIPRSKSKQIEVFLPASKIGDLGVLNMGKGCMGVPNIGGLGTSRSPKTRLGTQASPISEVIQATFPNLPLPQAKLKDKLQELIKLSSQAELKTAVKLLNLEEARTMGYMAEMISGKGPRKKSLNVWVRIYVLVRFLRELSTIQRPQSWLDSTAKKEEQKWNEGSSGSGGRSRYPGESGRSATCSSGRI